MSASERLDSIISMLDRLSAKVDSVLDKIDGIDYRLSELAKLA